MEIVTHLVKQGDVMECGEVVGSSHNLRSVARETGVGRVERQQGMVGMVGGVTCMGCSRIEIEALQR